MKAYAKFALPVLVLACLSCAPSSTPPSPDAGARAPRLRASKVGEAVTIRLSFNKSRYRLGEGMRVEIAYSCSRGSVLVYTGPPISPWQPYDLRFTRTGGSLVLFQPTTPAFRLPRWEDYHLVRAGQEHRVTATYATQLSTPLPGEYEATVVKGPAPSAKWLHEQARGGGPSASEAAKTALRLEEAGVAVWPDHEASSNTVRIKILPQ